MQRKSFSVAIRRKMDRMSLFNVCLYSLSKELQITPGEVMMQLATMNRKPAPEEIWVDQKGHANEQHKSTEVQH